MSFPGAADFIDRRHFFMHLAFASRDFYQPKKIG
jgi:hypothetical protein